MQTWAAILLAVLQVGAKLLERLDKAAYDDFRHTLADGDPVRVLGSQTGNTNLTTVYASSDKSENSGS